MTTKRQAIGIVRVSQTKGREGERFASPVEQLDRIHASCRRDGLQLIEVFEELDVSGGTPLARRTGLRTAVEAVEAGKASVIVAAYFDRLMRSLSVQRELVERVERAGGEVFAVDVGQVTHGSATKKLSGTLLGAFAEYQRDTARERSGDAQRRAVERGVLPYPKVPAGYRRGEDGRLVPHPGEAPLVAKAFEMRAEGKSVENIRTFLAEHGIKRSYHGIQRLLASPVMLGEIHFGELVNESAHEPIVEAETWSKVQAIRVPRGRRLTSERLLARLGVLRCAACGSRMVVGTGSRDKYPVYRCPPNGDCERRVGISAVMAEEVIVERVRAALADIHGRASADANVRDAERKLDRAQDALRAAIQAFTGFEDVPDTRERLTELRQARDDAQARLDRLGGSRISVDVNAARDWDLLTLDERRALIRATVERATVVPGRGPERLTVELFSE